jgi:hypothetical protein
LRRDARRSNGNGGDDRVDTPPSAYMRLELTREIASAATMVDACRP